TRHKGTGLGLAICKKIIELQGGNISVESEPGQGSAFSFELPMKQCEPAEVLEDRQLNDDIMAELVKDKYVLFAEDNKLNVLLGTTILKKWKIKYDIAYDGGEAFELFKKNRYDIVLTDMQMPVMNGLELTELIRKFPDAYKSNIPIMALTANVMKEDRDTYLKAGINDVILKPFHEKDLVERVAISLQDSTNVLRFVS
ncbi:MAG TPA: response regulator, partial [Mucilaginibacter sp.]